MNFVEFNERLTCVLKTSAIASLAILISLCLPKATLAQVDLPAAPLNGPMGVASANANGKSIFVSNSMLSGILPEIPNLEIGYLYTFAEEARRGALTLDYSAPFQINKVNTILFETHGRFDDFFESFFGDDEAVAQIFLGGAYRWRITPNSLVGFNSFLRFNRISKAWYTSGVVGGKFAFKGVGNSVTTLKLNYYGNVFENGGSVAWLYSKQPGDFRLNLSYRHPGILPAPYLKSMDLKFSGTHYQYYRGQKLKGWSAGAELNSKDRVLKLKCDVGFDDSSKGFVTVGASATMGFEVEKLISLENPFSKP